MLFTMASQEPSHCHGRPSLRLYRKLAVARAGHNRPADRAKRVRIGTAARGLSQREAVRARRLLAVQGGGELHDSHPSRFPSQLTGDDRYMYLTWAL